MNKNNFIKKFKNLILSGNHRVLNEFCYRHKREVIPYRLYKYTKIDKYTIENLAASQVCLNNPRSFNDPFDCWSYKVEAERQLQPSDESLDIIRQVARKLFNVEISIDELRGTGYIDSLQRISNVLPIDQRGFFIEKMKATHESLVQTSHEGANSLLDNLIRVACFTENPPTKLLMWSHYADYHKGICLEYDFRNCDDDTYAMLNPMIYQENLQNVNGDFKSFEYYYCKVLQTILFKSKEWSYEREWRLVKSLSIPSSDAVKCFHGLPFLKHIYIGVCADDNDALGIIQYAHSRNISVSKMCRNDRDFFLHSYPI